MRASGGGGEVVAFLRGFCSVLAPRSLSLSLSLTLVEGLGWLWEQGRAGGSFEGQSGSRGMAHLFFARATLHNVHLSLLFPGSQGRAMGPWVQKKSLYSRFYMLYAFYFTLFHTKAPKYYELPLRNTDTRDIPVLIMW